MDRYGIIYKITNNVNGKIYIGQTTRKTGFNGRYCYKGKGMERIYNTYLHNIKANENYNVHLFNAIKKYGLESFEVDEEFDIAYSKKELDEKEIYWIDYYNSANYENGYNHSLGGCTNNFSKDSYLNNLGKRYRPIYCFDTREIYLTLAEAEEKTGIGARTIQSNCNQKTKYATTRSGLKMRFKYINTGKHYRKPVTCITTGETFETLTEAAEKYRCKVENISSCIQGKYKSAGKHPETREKLKWVYALDYKLDLLAI